MSDWISKAFKAIEHNRYVILALLLTAVMAVYAAGCQSTTTGLGGQKQVTRAQLQQQLLGHQQQLKGQQAAIEAQKQTAIVQAQQAQANLETKAQALGMKTSDLDAQFQQRIDDLNRQDTLKKQVFDQLGGLITSLAAGAVNPVSGVTGALAIGSLLFGMGTAADNKRKDKVIGAQKARLAASATPHPPPAAASG